MLLFTASLIYLLAAMEAPFHPQNTTTSAASFRYDHGAVVRGDTTKKEIALVFTGHEFADGGTNILQTLQQQHIKASFFLTGDFYRSKEFAPLISQLKKNGHYLGAHSNKHLLYADWSKRDSLLITKQEFKKDLLQNYAEMKRFGISKSNVSLFLPLMNGTMILLLYGRRNWVCSSSIIRREQNRRLIIPGLN